VSNIAFCQVSEDVLQGMNTQLLEMQHNYCFRFIRE